MACSNYAYQQLPDDQLPLPEQETVESPSPIQEEGPEKLKCTIRLYDITGSLRRDGSFMLKVMPSHLADEMIEAMAHLSLYGHPQGFINVLNENGEEKCCNWEVELNDQLKVDVKMWGNQANCGIHFTTKNTLTRHDIVSQTMNRLPSDCASVEFAIQSHCERTCERRFTITVTIDADQHNTQTRDYNVMFIRKP